MQRLGDRRYPPDGGYTPDQAREIAAVSRMLGRQIGLLLDRQGRVALLILGSPSGILIPELPRERSRTNRLRGLRLVHSHLSPDLLSQEDLMDMLVLRLDSIAVLTVNEYGEPVSFQSAHLVPDSGGAEPYRVHPPVPWNQVDIHFTQEAEAIEDELGRVSEASRQMDNAPRALLVSVSTEPKSVQERQLEELAELARTAGLHVAGTLMQRVAAIHPRHLLGKGKLMELEVMALEGQVGMLVFNGELSPAQLSHIATLTERTVLDRTQLILDIFAQRATSRAGRLQVELAQLQYTMPRLVGRHRAMDRLMGGIGGRGPGETRLETDRRKVRERMRRLKDELDKVRRSRATNRAKREREGLPMIALVGYTNAGKSTLFNKLTHADVLVENKLFATLDPANRRLRLPDERDYILADTVGFIRSLPKELKEAFMATLEELHQADILLHVLDASHPDMHEQYEAVEAILADMGLNETPRLVALNKCDKLDAEAVQALQGLFPGAVSIAAAPGTNLEALVAALVRLYERIGKEVEQPKPE